MAKLKPCRTCGHEVSKRAKTCPNCGEKNPAGPKQYGCGTLLLLLVVGFGVITVLMPDEEQLGPAAPSCESVSPQLVISIEDGLTVQGGGLISEAAAVRSGAHTNAWYVAARIEGPGIDGMVGVWATNRLDGSGVLYAVDNIANDFSDWGDGRTTDAAFSMGDPGATASRTCLP